MLHPTDYEKALHDFLEEFAGGAKFIGQSDSDDAPHLLAVLTRVVAGTIGRAVTFEAARAWRLLEHGFWHGNAAAGSRVVVFFHSQAPKHGRGYADARGSGHDRRWRDFPSRRTNDEPTDQTPRNPWRFPRSTQAAVFSRPETTQATSSTTTFGPLRPTIFTARPFATISPRVMTSRS